MLCYNQYTHVQSLRPSLEKWFDGLVLYLHHFRETHPFHSPQGLIRHQTSQRGELTILISSVHTQDSVQIRGRHYSKEEMTV